MPISTLRITEIFYSIQGESTKTGLPTVFVRLTGCPLRCQYCDTAYAFSGGKKLTYSDIMETIRSYACKDVCITGGEPLAQPAILAFMHALCDEGFRVSLETSGALDIAPVDSRVMIVMDIKTPDSKEQHRNLLTNMHHLKPDDQIKFVLCSAEDYQWASDFIRQHAHDHPASILFSPCADTLPPHLLAEWILRDRLQVRFQLQLHKVLWHNAQGR